MSMKLAFICACVCVLLHSGAESAGIQCPPAGFDTVKNFNLTQYISAPWYIQQQMENSYQLKEDLYCVRAKYVPEDPADYNQGIVVQNYRNRGGVNQNPGGSSGAGGGPCFGFDQIKAFPAYPEGTGPTDASKVLVGPAPLAVLGKGLLGDYWVVAVGPSANKTIGYDWAIVSAGAPNVSTANGCRTGTAKMQFDRAVVNGVGLWLFSRKPVDPEGVTVMRAKAEELGFDTSVLVNVTQTGCEYIKADPECDAEGPVGCTRDFPFNLTQGLPTNLTGPFNISLSLPTNWTSRCFNDSDNLPGVFGNGTVLPGLLNRTGNSTSAGGIRANFSWMLQLVGALLVCVASSCVV